MTDLQIQERIENLGGFLSEDGKRAYFTFDQPVSDNDGETITLKDALDIQGQMFDLGFSGALIGTPHNDGDVNGIFFEIH